MKIIQHIGSLVFVLADEAEKVQQIREPTIKNSLQNEYKE